MPVKTDHDPYLSDLCIINLKSIIRRRIIILLVVAGHLDDVHHFGNAKEAAILEAYKGAIDVPYSVAVKCLEVLRLAKQLAPKGLAASASDVGVGALMANAGMHGAILNVKINMPEVKDEAYKADMLANIESGESQVVDARDPGRFSGEFVDTVHNMPSGHIPGSCNMPFFRLFDEDGTFKSPDELRALFDEAGIDPQRPVIASCGSGITACALLFALDMIGAPDTALYDGSWIDWGGDPSTPNATSVEQ